MNRDDGDESDEFVWTGSDAGAERRREPRVRANFNAQITLLGKAEGLSDTATVIDISERGLAFTCHRTLGVGPLVELQVKGCRLICEVRNARDREYSNMPECIVGVAIVQILGGGRAWRQMMHEYRAA